LPTPPFSLTRAAERLLVPWTRLDWPLAWGALFGRNAPLALELGFGNGDYIRERATRDSGTDWVGAEVSWGSVERLLARLDRGGIGNVRVVQGDGAYLLEHLFPPGSLDEIVINHPDPWPKKRHHGRRLVQPSFVRLAASRLRRGSLLTIVTDHADYAEWIREVLEGQDAFRSEFATSWVETLPDRSPTKYERKGLEAGSKIHYFVWRNHAGPQDAPSRKEPLEPMPNVILVGLPRGTHPLEEFSPWSWSAEHRETPVHVSFLSVYSRRPGPEWLVEALVKEGGFTQHLLLSLSPREDGRLVIQPSPVGYPRPTWGVKQAVAHLAGWLLRRHPDLAVEGSTVGPLPPPPSPSS